MNSYKALNRQVFTKDAYSLVPIRYEDRMDIMRWRNEQIYHLRQSKPLTAEDQDNYFNNVVAALFDHEKPDQILFSYLENEKCIGYGGLVHINWIDRNAEISFIMKTDLEGIDFEYHWCTFLSLIQQVAFEETGFHKIYTFAFNLRPKLYSALITSNFTHEATLKQHCRFEGEYIDVLIHSKINNLYLRVATLSDIDLTFRWASDPEVRKYSFNTEIITKSGHLEWFKNKLSDDNCIYLILEDSLGNALGSIRMDKMGQVGVISYLLDPRFHGKGLGTSIIRLLEDYIIKMSEDINVLVGNVMESNIASVKIFEKLKYKQIKEENSLKFVKEIR